MTACSREVRKAAARAISAPNTFNQPRRGDLNLAQDAVLGRNEKKEQSRRDG